MCDEPRSAARSTPALSSSDEPRAFDALAASGQEFREDLRDSRTLKQEFVAAFDKVQRLEEAYAKCEEDLAAAGEDADAMQDALNRMAELQVRLLQRAAREGSFWTPS